MLQIFRPKFGLTVLGGRRRGFDGRGDGHGLGLGLGFVSVSVSTSVKSASAPPKYSKPYMTTKFEYPIEWKRQIRLDA